MDHSMRRLSKFISNKFSRDSNIYMREISFTEVGLLLNRFRFDNLIEQISKVQMFSLIILASASSLILVVRRRLRICWKEMLCTLSKVIFIAIVSMYLRLISSGTANWMAPEVITQRGLGRFADIWSIGCVLIEMATGKPPWSGGNQMATMFQIAKTKTPPPYPPNISNDCRDFLDHCFK